MKTLLRVAAGALSLALFGATAVAVNAEPAVSTKRAITITNEVRIRPNPNTQNPELAWMPAGATPTYICYADGENVGGTTKWFKVGWNGVEGYYSSIADDVPLSLQGDILGNYGIPQCGTGADINQGSGADLMVNPAPLNYDRESAVAWGLAHARDTQPWT